MHASRCLFAIILMSAPACGPGAHGDHPMPFVARADHLAAWDGEAYRPLFIKGINLGTGLPGTQPGELPATREQYLRWFTRMGELGVNAIRVYTLHYPRFYEAVHEYNNFRPDRPLYLLHGIWLDEDHPADGWDLYGYTEHFDAGIEEVLDCVHGNRVVDHRLGRAYGEYRVDVARWVMGWVLGREVFPIEVVWTDTYHAESTSYAGASVSLAEGSPTEAWAAARLDHVVTYERERYGTERPVSLSSWPTLDPLFHVTESHAPGLSDAPEDAEGEDRAAIDLADLDMTGAPAGYFATFHAYPYYPNFVSDDPGYRTFADDRGRNSYLGYLTDLVGHYGAGGKSVFVGEFGVPSSWGNAHYGFAGMNHGGHDEVGQGEAAARMISNVYDAGCSGGALFAWIDEWWKRTWIVDELTMPRDRYPLWPDLTSPEQNFGLLAFDPEPPTFEHFAPAGGQERIISVQSDFNALFFYVRVALDPALSPGETLVLGYDTYGDALGETVLPGGTRTEHRCELALVLTAPGAAQLYVTQAYDLFGIWHGVSEPHQLYRSVPSDGAPWAEVRWMNDDEHGSDDGRHRFPRTVDPIGRLRVRRADAPPTSRDAVVIGDGGVVEIRIPWTMLQFADPSAVSVIHDDPDTHGRDTVESEGIRVVATLGGEVVATSRVKWPRWDVVPPYAEREKPSAKLYGEALWALPDAPRGR